MIPIIFYEKPNCKNNIKQKKELSSLGFKVLATNILQTKFSKEQLMSFFKNHDIKKCINKNAPDIKHNKINISELSSNALLELMIKNPILIKRPLMSLGSQKFCGFQLNLLLPHLLKGA